MKKFEELPRNSQALILAKLAMEMSVQKSPDIHHLAKARGTDLLGIWRSICRRAGQPICTMPAEAMCEQQ